MYIFTDKKSKRATLSPIITLFALSVFIFLALFCSGKISDFIKNGISLCTLSIIGSVFPFIILTDILVYFLDFTSMKLLRRGFEALFKINGYAISAFLVGIISGFPIGVRVSVDLYKKGIITRDECERLNAISNNAGPAFIVSAIGGMRGNLYEGVFIYVSSVLASITVGIILGINKKPSNTPYTPEKKHLSLVKSITDASQSTLYICGFIVFFSAVLQSISLIIKNEYVLMLIYPFFEVGSSASFLSRAYLPRALSLALTSFAVSFSGISVHLQARSILIGTDITQKIYYPAKLLCGIISFILTYVFTLIVGFI